MRKKRWHVYAKKPFGSPQHLVNYLGRYVHRVALSNDRIFSVHNGKVTFLLLPQLHVRIPDKTYPIQDSTF